MIPALVGAEKNIKNAAESDMERERGFDESIEKWLEKAEYRDFS